MKTTKYELIADSVTELIEAGSLKAGEKIPSIRGMSIKMNCSVMTVLEAYRLLEDRGFIESKPQSGYYVKQEHLRIMQSWAKMPQAVKEDIKIYTDSVNISPQISKLYADLNLEGVVPFGAGLPDSEFFPNEQLSKSMANVVRQFPMDTNQYSISEGEKCLRQCISKKMMDFGCMVYYQDIIVTPGATGALLLALRAVAGPGSVVAVESPGYYGFYSLLNFLGIKAVEIPSDPVNGFSVCSLRQAIGEEQVSAILLSSRVSNPNGATMSEQSKLELAEVCNEHNICVIDDDTYGDIYYGKDTPRPISYYCPDNSIYVGSFSKSLAPGYRIGWLVGGKYHHDLVKCHNAGLLAVAKPTQWAVTEFINSGKMTRHIKQLRKNYHDNLRYMQDAVYRYFPDGTCTSNPKGGHLLWVKLPEYVDSVVLAEQIMEHNITIAPGVIFSSRDLYRNYIRLNCAVTWNDNFEYAIKKVGDLTKLF